MPRLTCFKGTIFLLFAFFTLQQTACTKKETLQQIIYHASKNKIYKDIDEAKFAEVFEKTIEKESKKLNNPEFIRNFYEKNGFNAVLLKRFLPTEQINLLSDHLNEIDQHGLPPDRFNAQSFQVLIQEVLDKSQINSLDKAYEKLAQLEIQTANNLLSYSNALSFGVVNPTKLFKRYYMETLRPDTVSMEKVLDAQNLESYLDSIQPSSLEYKTLQKALGSSTAAPDKSEEETRKTIQVALERLRWKHEYDTVNLIYVNIPAFKLTIVKEGKPVEEMKVVVGTGRNSSGKDKINNHQQALADQPHSHETPILSSLIHSVQVNPEWNIPESIASKEILKHVQADRFYLANNGIDVLQNEKVIEDSESIDWSSFSKDDLPFRFRQRPGEDNALGKIKFLFKNNSSVYLHDTPAQAAFNRDIRASSHGCVRVEKPLDLAQALFGNDKKFKTIEKDMETPKTNAKNIALDSKRTVVLDYQTLIVKDGKIQFFPDVYGLDIVLYTHLMNL